MSLVRASRRTLITVGALAAALTLSACTGDAGGKSGGGGDTNFVAGTSGIVTVAEGKRTTAPRLSGKDLTGKPLDLADYKGKVVVLNLWGSWCAPCRAEAPYLAEVAEETKSKGVEFIGINTRDPQTGPALAFEKDYAVGYPSFHDPIGKLILKFPKGSLNPQAIPSTLVIDREGKIAARALTALDDKQLRSMIDPVVAEKAAEQ
ncbi:TlpA family protein disulfide reductase [Streptomyces sp. ICN441]|uniref:Redoxin domain-containing protein n=1 Tax=Streptomyces tirandamycinicus TaxID=2174846 RepID=A0A2S1SVA8_9ACTN|nr:MULTISPECIES: TlpA disulfide reductase family protein [Streptomyces]AWI30335.1 redoxin domain-containing protein [Streptomyces tirandamycinicus]TFE49536.1 TlpA family protein disulfide reductase [Streptomyces sp. ICN441]